MESLPIIPCQADNHECKHYPGCHLSRHHLFPKRTMDTPIKQRFGNLAINKLLVCRGVHELLDRFPEPIYPQVSEMKQIIKEQRGGKSNI